jgi:integrase
LWHVAGYSGLRRGELAALAWDEVDPDAGLLRVVRAIGEGGGRRYEKRPKSEAGRRTVELAPETVQVVTVHRREQKERRLLVGPGWRDHNLVFPDVDGSPLRPGVITERWVLLMRHHARKLGLPAIRFHDLRHSHATQLMATGARPDVVSKRLGHSSVAFTLSTYAPVLEGDQRASVARLFA